MSITVTVTEVQGTDLTIVEDQVVVTTTTTLSGGTDASNVTVTPVGTITATDLQSALEQLSDQKFVSATQPSSGDTNLEEGDLWYNTTDDTLNVYREGAWEEITLNAQLSEDYQGTEYTDVTLNGGYF